ncbi:Uncharacterized membrane protein [Deinococcus reticulitermitis]|uniref:DUF2254 domain-containing protein n=2 Tax=Deinococcus TaxID=1298 RepID=A0A7X1NYD6_9DEIO|nr:MULTISPECIES: DUF2254 domain-containing protein [Deinococcus]MPY68085.1 DUF2254 domain-containing protein [Deinococcus terrestris]SEJ93222.1 Uncharacterized membrane protein [Deinococcus reticulitermitis]
MRGRLAVLWTTLRDSFWFLPTVMVGLAVLLAEGAVNADERVELETLRAWPWVYGGSADGARSMLAAIAGSVIGVAGTTFSITIAALSLASSQMGPRLLEHFTRDRGNQITLGTFIATFAYCLLVLRTVRGGDESPFVPHVAVTLGLGLALVSLAILIYFIAHIAGSINVGRVVRLVSDELVSTIEAQFPERGDHPAPAAAAAPADPAHAREVRASAGGYLQALDVAGLLRLAGRHGAVIRLTVRPGQFVFPGMVVAHTAPAALGQVRAALVTGPRRTSPQDVEFAVQQLVEVAVRALSPGINDPFTAIAVLDHLGAALCRVSGREMPQREHAQGGQVRLVIPATDYGGLTDVMFHQIRQNGASHPAVMLRLLEVLAIVAEQERDPGRRSSLRRHAALTLRAALRETGEEADRRDLEKRFRRFQAAVQGTAG